MANGLDFSQDFFYRDADECMDPAEIDQPVTVYQAVLVLESRRPHHWRELMDELDLIGNEEGRHHKVVDLVRETNTCTNLRVPVEVWIDPEGFFTIDVYDDEESGLTGSFYF